MDAGGLNQLIEYGILGLWTLSLLISNHTMRSNFQSRYDDLNKNVVDVVNKNKELAEENQEKLDKALDKIEEGLDTMKQKYLEEKLRAEFKQSQELKE
jgi:aryl carrier-like protein